MKPTNITLRLIRPFLHMLFIVGIFYAFYKVRLVTDLIPMVQLPIPVINFQETMVYAIIAALSFVGIGIIKWLYELHKPIQKYFQTFTKVWLYRLITITFVAYFGQGFVFFFGISRFIILFSAGITFFALFFFDQIWHYFQSRFEKKQENKILIIGNNTLESNKAIEEIKNGFTEMTEFVNSKEIDEVDMEEYVMAVAVGSFQKEALQHIFEKTRFTNTRFYHISEWFFLEDVVYSPEVINNIIALEYKNSTLDGWSIVGKKAFDIIGGLLLLVMFAPLMIIIAMIIKVTSPGPIIYKQKRVGKDWREFIFLKFRSMYTHLSTGGEYGGKKAESMYQELIKTSNIRDNILPKIHNDPRITKIGKRIRKTSIDELPQLFCVLSGKMSLVGPRPHLPNEVAKYQDRQKRLLGIKPGITGYAQVFGRDGLDFDEEAKLDLYYIQNRSIFMDIYIIFATLGVVFKGK